MMRNAKKSWSAMMIVWALTVVCLFQVGCPERPQSSTLRECMKWGGTKAQCEAEFGIK